MFDCAMYKNDSAKHDGCGRVHLRCYKRSHVHANYTAQQLCVINHLSAIQGRFVVTAVSDGVTAKNLQSKAGREEGTRRYVSWHHQLSVLCLGGAERQH